MLTQLVALRDALDRTRFEMITSRSRAAKAREKARCLRTEAGQLRRAERVSARAVWPALEHLTDAASDT